MRIIVFSDSHGDPSGMRSALRKHRHTDKKLSLHRPAEYDRRLSE